MAVAYDAVQTATFYDTTSITTASFTIDTGSVGNRAATVGVHHFANTATGITASVGGESGTQLEDREATEGRVILFGIKAPAQGSQTGSAAWTNIQRGVLGVTTATGADQSTTFNGAAGDVEDGNTNAVSVTITSNSGDLTISHLSTGSALISTQNEVYNAAQNIRGQGDYGGGTGNTTHSWNDGWNRKSLVGCNIIQVAVGGIVILRRRRSA